MIQTRCKSGKIRKDEALGYFNSMIQTKPLPSIWTFNCLLGALSKMKQYSAVVSMCKQLMGYAHFGPDVSTMTIFMNCLCRLNRVDLGFPVLAITLKYGLQPNAYSMNTLLHGFSLAEATPFFQEIETKGYKCDEITYGTVINGLCKAGKTSKALEILTKMWEDGRFKPNQECYNPIIDSLCKERQIDESGNWEEGVRLLKSMIDYGALPNIVTYNSVLDALYKEGKTAEALNLVDEMFRGGEKPDVVTYNTLIKGLCRTRQWKEATRLSDEM
ncbi:pentatricopeptide repeat-containing protein [Pyrus ussuriensis x Pyrus communis]|uniref:Pentatricopeptide repeat-containing protein n=1 Tax=Pyrus ussuriensis x Pyrus communis TaxID=2448454 RepID=A0A5N5HCX8_9ROSA|nr:pentatricopeptide repeat-containing protein [Pyrus ussuriensis x Pyrus communis]